MICSKRATPQYRIHFLKKKIPFQTEMKSEKRRKITLLFHSFDLFFQKSKTKKNRHSFDAHLEQHKIKF
ncbi:MAG: hypothetical protein RL757_908 [Bacteroidota bacterium]|jgi:hypothetical protein